MTDAPASKGHNGGAELTDTERRALRMHHVKQLLAMEERIKPLREQRKKLRATAKADGFKLSEIDAAMRLATMEDQSIFVAEIKEMIEIAQAFNALPPGGQGDMFPDRRPMDEKCFDEGYVAGMEGKNPDPPYGADTKKGQDWLKGWHEGQRVMRDDLQSAMEKRNAASAERDDDAGDEDAGLDDETDDSDDDADGFDEVDGEEDDDFDEPASLPDVEAPRVH